MSKSLPPHGTQHAKAPLSFTISWSLLKFMPIELMKLSSHLILCCPCLLLPSIFPSIRVFSNESVLHIRWPKYWSFSLSSAYEYSGLVSFSFDCFDLLHFKRLLRIFSSTTIWKHQFFSVQPSLWFSFHGYCKDHSFDCMDFPLFFTSYKYPPWLLWHSFLLYTLPVWLLFTDYPPLSSPDFSATYALLLNNLLCFL